MTDAEVYVYGVGGTPLRAGGGRPLSATPSAVEGIFIGAAEVASLPDSGAAFNNVLAEANAYSVSQIDYADQDSRDMGRMYAASLIFARTGIELHRTKVRDAINAIATSPYNKNNPSTLGWSRNVAYIAYAADLINLATFDPTLEADLQAFLQGMLQESYPGDGSNSMQNAAERRPNNIGIHARVACTAIAAYIGDTALMQLMADLHYSYVEGGPSTYPSGSTETGESSFSWNVDQSWQADPNDPSSWMGIVPAGIVRDGNNFDGIFPEDYRRNGSYNPTDFPLTSITEYAWEDMMGVAGQTELLRRNGHPEAVGWGDNSTLRALTRLRFIYENYSHRGWSWAPGSSSTNGDDRSTPYLVNFLYGTSFPVPGSASIGRGLAFADWTHAGRTI